MLSGLLFISWRIFEILLLIPIVGILASFVHAYVHANLLTPDFILVLFIVAVLALAWAIFTLISYLRARHDALFVALVDLGFVGALIAGVYYLRGVAGANCTDASAGRLNGGFYVNVNTNRTCAMLKASWALAIIALISFFVTFLLALLVAHHHRRDNDRTVVKREYRSSRRSGGGNAHRSRSRDYNNRSSRDYDYRPSSGSRRHHSSSRRQYYV